MVLNHRDYEKSIKNLINDKIKFKDLSDVTIEQESKLQRSLTTLKNYVWSMKNMKNMKKIIQVVLLLLKIYESPKMHKPFDSNSLPNFYSIVSFIGTYNYNLSKYLCELLSPNLLNEFCTNDTFPFVEELRLFTNIPLKETIKVAVILSKPVRTPLVEMLFIIFRTHRK